MVGQLHSSSRRLNPMLRAAISLDIDCLSDVPVPLEVRLGCKATTLQAIAKLEIGSTVPLDRAAGETFDVYVGDLHLGTAEVVIVDGRLAIRITDLFLIAAAPAN